MVIVIQCQKQKVRQGSRSVSSSCPLILLKHKYTNAIPPLHTFFLKSHEGKFLKTEKVVEYGEN